MVERNLQGTDGVINSLAMFGIQFKAESPRREGSCQGLFVSGQCADLTADRIGKVTPLILVNPDHAMDGKAEDRRSKPPLVKTTLPEVSNCGGGHSIRRLVANNNRTTTGASRPKQPSQSVVEKNRQCPCNCDVWSRAWGRNQRHKIASISPSRMRRSVTITPEKSVLSTSPG